MADTRYVLLYRGTNEAFKTLIRNSAEDSYKKVEELYTTDHKIASGSADEKREAENEKMNFIIEGNDSTNPKGSMLFYFDGTKRISHKKWIVEKSGWVIRDWKSIEDKIAPVGEYVGQYVMVNGDKPSTATIVSKTNPVTGNITVLQKWADVTQNGGTVVIKNGISAVTTDWLIGYIKQKTIGKLKTEDYSLYGTKKNGLREYNGSNVYIPFTPGIEILVGPEALNAVIKLTNWRYADGSSWSAYTGYAVNASMSDSVFTAFTIMASHIEQQIIPAHYEDVIDAPYMIKDTYKKVDGEPWFVYKSSGSLQSIIETAKKVADSIGLENLKLIKTVPIDQKIRIS